jgi:hypothetical protein
MPCNGSECDDRLIQVTMTRSAAERFKAALSYADAICAGYAESNRAAGTAAKIREHADWLRWGRSRVFHAESIADAEAGPAAALPGSDRTGG